MSIELTTSELSMARKVGIESQRRYRGFVEAGDVESELVLWMLGPTREEKIRQWREGQGYRALFRSLKHEARRFCEREKAARVGYGPEDNSGYSVPLLRELLPIAVDGDWTDDDLIDGQPHAHRTQQLVDVRRGLELVDENTREVLEAAVAADWDYEFLAVTYSTEEEPLQYKTVHKRVERALSKLATRLSEVPDPDSVEGLRAWQRQLYSTIPRHSNANMIHYQERL